MEGCDQFKKHYGQIVLLIGGLSVCCFCFVGCRTAEDHLRLAIAKDPTILESKELVRVDTVIPDPILIRDTFVTSQVDTVTKVEKDYKVRLIRSYDTINLSVDCIPDTIIKTEVIELPPQVNYIPTPFWKRVLIPALLSLFGFGFLVFVWKVIT